jgi:hypothetical protein
LLIIVAIKNQSERRKPAKAGRTDKKIGFKFRQEAGIRQREKEIGLSSMGAPTCVRPPKYQNYVAV